MPSEHGLHRAGRVLSSDWSVNSFMMFVFEKKLVMLWTENSH